MEEAAQQALQDRVDNLQCQLDEHRLPPTGNRSRGKQTGPVFQRRT